MAKFSAPARTLADLHIGQSAVVAALTCAGAQRDRLMDLGVLPGTRITAEMRSPLGDPVAYRIRGALIALRREQTMTIGIAEDPRGDQDAPSPHPLPSARGGG